MGSTGPSAAGDTWGKDSLIGKLIFEQKGRVSKSGSQVAVWGSSSPGRSQQVQTQKSWWA